MFGLKTETMCTLIRALFGVNVICLVLYLWALPARAADAGMSPDQLFIVAMVTAVLSALSTVALAIIAYLTTRLRADVQHVATKAEGHADETRTNIGELAKAINGVKSEVVSAVKNAAIQEGAKLESERSDSPAADQRAIDRFAEVAKESTDASRAATAIAGDAEKVILAIPVEKVILQVPGANKGDKP